MTHMSEPLDSPLYLVTLCLLTLCAACPRSNSSPSPPSAALPVLGGALDDFLRVELPSGAEVAPEPPPAECEASRVRMFSSGGRSYRLVEGRMARTVTAADFSVMIKRVILAAEDEMAAAEPRFISLQMARPEMKGMLVTGALPIDDGGWLLVGIAYLRLPGGELFSLELLQRGEADAGSSPQLLQAIASSASPGPRAPTVGPGVYQLPPLQINLPAEHLLQCHVGPDFHVYNIQKLQELQEAAQGHVFFYVGPAPQPQKPADLKERPEWAQGLRESGQILGKPIVWRVLQADRVIEVAHLGAVVDVGDGNAVDIRVVCANAAECARLQGIAESLSMQR